MTILESSDFTKGSDLSKLDLCDSNGDDAKEEEEVVVEKNSNSIPPVEVIGLILSLLGDNARDVVLASATCRQWRAGMRSCLSRISLTDVCLPTASDLSLLLNSCPNIEQLNLANVKLAVVDDQPPTTMSTLHFNGPFLKTAHVDGLKIDRFVLEAKRLEELELRGCRIKICKLIVRDGRLKTLKIDKVGRFHIMGGENKDLEVLHLSIVTLTWSKLSPLLVSSSLNLTELALPGVEFQAHEVDLGNNLLVCYPQLTRLLLKYDPKGGVNKYGFLGSSLLQNVHLLELDWTFADELFLPSLIALIDRCPNLVNVIFHGGLPKNKTKSSIAMLASVHGFVELTRRYMNVHFDYELRS